MLSFQQVSSGTLDTIPVLQPGIHLGYLVADSGHHNVLFLFVEGVDFVEIL